MPGTATLSDIVDEQKPGVASLSDIDESTPEERATVSKAIASVPYHPPKMEWSSVAPIPEVESEKAEPYSLKKAAVGGLTDILTHPEPGAETGIAPLGPEAVKGTEELGTKGQRWRGAARLASTGLQAAAPVLAPTAGLEAPVSTAIGLGTGYGASKIAGKVSEKLGAEPETKQVVEDLAFWAPTVAGMLSGASGTAVDTPEAKGAGVTAFGDRVRAGVAVTPEQVSVAGKVGPFSGRVNIPRNGQPTAPAIEPQTIEGQHANAPTDSDVAVAVAAQREHLQATRMASGLPPVEPPAPAPPPPPAPQIGMDQVANMGEAIAKLPPDLRAQAMVEAHGKLSQVFMQMGKVVNPHDGKLTVITKPEQADKLATDFINGEVERRDKLAEEAQKKAESAQGKSVRKPSGVVEKPVEAAENSSVGLAHVNDIETANDQRSGLPAGERGATASAQSNEPGRKVESARPAGQSGNLPVNAGTGENPERTSEVPRFVKGDRVTLQDGSEATIHYSSPGMRLVRLVTEDGRRMTVSGKDVNKLQRVAQSPTEAQPQPTEAKVAPEIIGEPTAKPRTPGEPLEHGFNTQPAEDLGQAVREATQKTEGALPRGERRKIERTTEEQQTQELFGQARKELGEDATSDQVMARVGELKKAGENSPAPVENSAKPLQSEENKASHISEISPEEAPKFKHRSTQVNIPKESEASQAIEAARSRISKEDLAGDGKDIGGNHVTVRWGLQAADDADLSKLKSYISSLAPFEASLGKTSKFKPSESSDGAAVIQAPIEAPELHKINDEISKHGDFTEPTFKYSPHATVAYVKPEKADRYTGMDVTHGKKFTVNSIAISDRNGGQEEVPLKGSSNLTEAPAKSEPKPEKSAGPAPGEVGRMKVSDLKLAPARFQYKLGTDAEGVSSLLKDTTKFNPNLANTISVWEDPEDGKFYVVNGHHRYELAKRTGQKEIDVRHIQASDATHARAIGAMQNIAEGRGTAVDAAKFFRDSGIKIEDLEKEGISLGEATAKNGLALSRLDQPIFNKVVSGDLRVGRGVAIGEATSDAAEQKAILNLVERREARGQKISDGQLSELVRFVKEAGKEQETTADLFGSQQITKSLALEKAEVSDYIKTQLAKDRKLFGFVAKEGRAGELARGENVINVEKSKEISTGAQQAEEVYNRLSSRGGDIASILDEAAGKISESDSERSRAEIKRQAYERVRDAVSRTLGGGQEGSPQRSEATPEAAREIESRAVQEKPVPEQHPPVSGPGSSEYEALKAKVAALEKPAPSSFHATAEKLRKAEGQRIAERLRTVADGMEKQIDDKRREMTQNPTPKRMREYRSRLHDATNMERVQKAMRTLADAHESGEVPREVSALRSKDDIHRLVYQGTESGGYYDVIPSRERYANKTPEAKKLQEMMDKQSTETSEAKAAKEKASQISQLEAQVQFQKLPGYFPTPKAVISRLLDISFIEPGMKVLEPSAGKGDIAEQIRQQYPEAKLDVVEQQSKLRQILELKGFHVVGEDFLEHKGEYDRIIMNPPFERGADVEHVRHAYDLLKPGGRLVAVMSPHAEFANDKKSQEFREWLDDHGGNTEKLPESSFKESGTGVASRRVVIDKPEAKQDTADKSVALFSNDTEKPAPTFYSKAASVAFEKVSNNAPGSSILATLKNNGVKPEEIKWLGLDDFLAGKFRVQKKDLMSHILHNLMQVSEVSKGRRTGEQQEAIDKAKSRRDVSEGKFREIATKEIAEKLNDALAGHTPERAAESAKILADEILTSSRSSAEILYDRFRQRRVLDTILRQDFGTDWGSANESQRKQAIELQAKEIDGREPSDKLLEAGRNLFNDNQSLHMTRKENQLPTKYESYTLPGPKENYTELLLTLPEPRNQAKFDPAKVEIRRDRRSVTQGSTAIYYDGKRLASYSDDPTLQTDGSYKQRPESYWMGVAKDVFTAGDPRNSVQSLAGGFRSGHFEEPNVLTHVRFDDRWTSADGTSYTPPQKMLFVEEVQSDWHQKGKKQGYASSQGISKIKDDLDKAQRATSLAYADLRPLLKRDEFGGWDNASDAARDAAGVANGGTGNEYSPDTLEAAKKWKLARDREDSLVAELGSTRNAVPDAPFKTDWHELAMKRMLRYAAEHGYERLGWVTGEQTAQRYDLSKHVDEIKAFRRSDGNVDLMVFQKGRPGHHDIDNVAPEKLGETVGKDLAEKILQQPVKGFDNEGWRTYSGLDLKVGGEWAKRLYDQAIPNFLNKVGKKWGAKVGESKIPHDIRGTIYERGRAVRVVEESSPWHGFNLQYEGGETFGTWPDRASAERALKSQQAAYDDGIPGDTVHSINITPAMAHSVVYEGQPLFQNDPYALIRDRAPEAWAHIASKATASPVQQSGLRPYVEMNSEGLQLVARAIRRPFLGASIPPKNVPEIFAGFDDIFKKIKKTSPEAAANLEQIKQAIKGAVDKDSGVTITPKRDLFNSQHDLRILHEELFHAEVQHGPGRGVLARGVPAEMINDPGIRQMVMRIENETGRSEESLPEVIIAEAMADIVTGTPHELKPELAEKTATKYYEAVGEMHGVGTLEKAQAIQDLVDEKARTLGLTKEGEGFHEKYNQPARAALRAVLEKYRAKDGAGREPIGTGEVARREGERAAGSPSPGNESLNALPGKGAGSGEPGSAGALASTAPVGLTDEELAEWSKSKGFRTEPAGEQLGMFGQNEPVHRVYRLGGKGKEQVGLAYQSQIDKLNQPKAEPTEPFALTGDEAPRDDQPRLFGAGDMGEIIGTPQQKGSLRRNEEESTGSLFNSDKGTFEPAKVSEAIRKAKGPLGEYLRSEVINNKIARRLHSGMYDLESQYSADVLRAVHTMTATLKEAGPKAKEIFAGIYHHMENPEGHPLTAEQDKFFDDVILPISEDTDVKFTRLEELLGKADANLIENYVHRVVKGKGSFFDRILQGVKGTGRGNLLTKTSPQTKHRTMMALERNDGIYQQRMVISIKGGQVTAWENGHPENLGGISHTDEGKVWQDKDGGLWTLRQATTQEIEKHTDLRYYHNALASVMVSNLQVRKALRGAEFINTFKASPEFKDIAMKVGTGTPPNQWRMTQLPQMRDYYFEPHTAEVLDWYANRIKGQDPNIFDKLNSFLRTSIFFNPLIHIPNISVHWLAEKGPSGYIPTTGGRETYQSSVRAINAVIHQNQDFLKLLDAGAPMQSQREDTAKLTKLFFDQLSEGLEKNEDWALKLAKTVGMSPVNLTKALYRFSGRATWVTNDIAFAQAVFAKMDSGMDMKAAIEQTAKHIPDYRLPVRMLNSAGLSKILSNNAITMFMAYHYGALKSYAEMAKSAVGASEPPPGRSKAGEAAHGWELLAGVGLITFILYPLIADEVAKKITGDKNARFRRAGAATFPYNAYMLATHQKSASDVLQSVVTPAVGTKTAGELVTNRDFYTGRKIYDPLDSWQDEAQQVGRKLLESVSPVGQGSRVWEGGERRKRALYGMVGISFPKTRAEKVASDIALEKIGTAPQDEAKMESYQERHAVLDALRKGDSGPLNDARDKGDLSPAQVKKLRHRASLTPLQDTVNNFTYLETMKVMEAAKADGNQEQVEDLERVLARKRRNMWARHEQVPAEVE